MTQTQEQPAYTLIPDAYALPVSEVARHLSVVPDKGLTNRQAQERLKLYGPNTIISQPPPPWWAILVNQLKSPLVVLLSIACGLSFVFGDLAEGLAILSVILIDAVIGYTAETRALKSMAALKSLSQSTALVRRDDHIASIPTDALVPGDVVIIEAGIRVGADMRLVTASRLQLDESALTGESAPVSKDPAPVSGQPHITDRRSMLYRGTAVTRGEGEAIVAATAKNTELGRIATLTGEADAARSPLEKRLEHLSKQLLWLTLFIAAAISLSGWLGGQSILTMIEVGIALAVAAVPEGLPIVATLALARGMWRMARHNAIVKQLNVIETLGSTNVIFTDKTGTLTENRMTVTGLDLAGGSLEKDTESDAFTGGTLQTNAEDCVLAARIMALCSSASIDNAGKTHDGHKTDSQATGDPMEVALLQAAHSLGVDRETLLRAMPEHGREPFDPDTRMMATYHKQPDSDGLFIAVKGAPSSVLSCATHQKDQTGIVPLNKGDWKTRTDNLTAQGLRVLGLAYRTDAPPMTPPFENLIFLGLVALLDPPRAGVKDAVNACRCAGIDVVMVTGDNHLTGLFIANAVGIIDKPEAAIAMTGYDLEQAQKTKSLNDIRVFARVSPEQKLNLIAHYQDQGAVIAMTGDGVNDAPALKKADVGIAMGQRGTDVARDAADIILKDDAFSSIVKAVEMGRAIFANIRTFVIYLLSCNLSEILIVGIATLSGLPLPLLPLQILFLNLVTDVFPAFALGVGRGSQDLMKQTPRKAEDGILCRRHWKAIIGYGCLITMATLISFITALHILETGPKAATSIAFLTLALAQLWHVFNMRSRKSEFLKNEITKNPLIWGALGLCIMLLGVATYTPLSDILSISAPDFQEWGLILGSSLIPFIWGQIAKTPFGQRSSVRINQLDKSES